MKGYITSKKVGNIARQSENSLIVVWGMNNNWETIRIPKESIKRQKLAEMLKSEARHLFFRPQFSKAAFDDFPLSNTQWERAADFGWIDNDKIILEAKIQNVPGKPLNIASLKLHHAKYSPGERVILRADWGEHLMFKSTTRNKMVSDEQPLLKAGVKGIITSISEEGDYQLRTKDGEYAWIQERFLRATFFGI